MFDTEEAMSESARYHVFAHAVTPVSTRRPCRVSALLRVQSMAIGDQVWGLHDTYTRPHFPVT